VSDEINAVGQFGHSTLMARNGVCQYAGWNDEEDNRRTPRSALLNSRFIAET